MSVTTKEKVVRESIERINKRVAYIDSILNARPLLEIMELRQEIFGSMPKDILDPLFIKEVRRAAAKEKELMAVAKLQTNKTMEFIKEKCLLTNELGDLNSELYYIDLNKKKAQA